ncbi:TraX family protein [Erysipelothrix urinaevulpis]|uniref:TraX family protein n=1 Tax=Erysipelothrix urinaevulpis TaxID=2683717 RepID=UPI001356EDE3|nr:TraX family protein [Erysipelothrix urinaevulpis]
MKQIIHNKGFTAYQLKIGALFFMILDHCHTYLGIGPTWIALLPRFVAPLFVYFLVEGFHYTSDRRKYFTRVAIFATLMFIGNISINYYFKNVDPMTNQMTLYSLLQGNNIFFTLSLHLLLLGCIERFKRVNAAHRLIYAVAFILITFVSLAFSEGGLYLYPILFLSYSFMNDKQTLSAGIIAWSLLFFIKAIITYATGASGISLIDTLLFNNEWAMAFVVVPLLLYSNQRGRNDSFSKWLFYIVYPAHLWILMILRYLIIA